MVSLIHRQIPGVVSGPWPIPQDRPCSEYPLGTQARNYHGGHWLRVESGWQWMGGTEYAGGIFPTLGEGAIGDCVHLPEESHA